MKKKNRVEIPTDIAQQVLVSSRHTCCICREIQGQIHHIDEDPSNNDMDNLAVLCVYCHQKVHTQAPFQRGFKPEHIKQYRNEWVLIVKEAKEGKRLLMGAAGGPGQGGQGGTVMIIAEKMIGGGIDVSGGDGEIGGNAGTAVLQVKDLNLTAEIKAKGGKSNKK